MVGATLNAGQAHRQLPHDGPTIKADVSRRRLMGHVTAEIEFPREEAARQFQAPTGWGGKSPETR
ncbi:hypothetical protein EP7_004449 [Isosphaeraceae bacterium EP7]